MNKSVKSNTSTVLAAQRRPILGGAAAGLIVTALGHNNLLPQSVSSIVTTANIAFMVLLIVAMIKPERFAGVIQTPPSFAAMAFFGTAWLAGALVSGNTWWALGVIAIGVATAVIVVAPQIGRKVGA